MERSNNGRVTETYFPDNTFVITYREKRELPGYNSYAENTINLIYLDEGTVIKSRDDGEVILIGACDRYALNERGEKEKVMILITFYNCLESLKKGNLVFILLKCKKVCFFIVSSLNFKLNRYNLDARR